MDFSAQHVLLLGLDAQGFALARHLRQVQASVRLLAIAGEEQHEAQDHAQELAGLLQDPQISLTTCASLESVGSAEVLADITLLVWTPSALMDARYSALLELSLPHLSELDVFALALSNLRLRYGYAPKVIAITGSNGKTTVASLVRQFAQRAGHKVQVLAQQPKLESFLHLDFAAPTISVDQLALAEDLVPEVAMEQAEVCPSIPELPLATPLAAEIAALPTLWILLLNLEQLRLSSHLQADAASVLNVTPEEAKNSVEMARVFAAQTIRVLNRDDVQSIQMQPRMIASLKDEAQIARVLSFGSHEPQAVDCLGLSTERGVQWLSVAVEVDESAQDIKPKRRKKGDVVLPAEIELKHLMPADALKIFGQHNACNALAALALCRAIGLAFAPLLHALRDYKGEPQRLEWVRSLAAVNWYDDGASQNLTASVAAIKAIAGQLTSDEQAITWIVQAGTQDVSRLAGQLPSQLRNVIVLNAADAALASTMLESMAATLVGSGVQFYLVAEVAQALAQATQLAKAGDAVVFSPAKQGGLTSEMQNALQELALAHGELV